jgi:hypothetical protein
VDQILEGEEPSQRSVSDPNSRVTAEPNEIRQKRDRRIFGRYKLCRWGFFEAKRPFVVNPANRAGRRRTP